MIAARAPFRPWPLIVPVLLLLAGGLLLGHELLQGWYAHDEGALGQSAERVLAGEVPHRDFDEIYTGPLSYWHALNIRVFGTNAPALRYPLFGVALAWLLGLYRLLIRFAPAGGAALVAFTAFVWSVPNYPAGVPSWYVLFAATFGALAIVRWIEDGRRRWLVLAGLAGGVAFLFKLSGALFFVGGGLAILSLALASTDDPAGGPRVPTSVVGGGTFAASVGLAWIVGRGGESELLRHALPLLFIVGALVAGPRVRAGRPASIRLQALHPLALFALGGLMPIAALFAWYAAIGGLGDLIQGVFVLPFRRVASAAYHPPPVVAILWCLPVMFLLGIRTAAARWRMVATVIAAVWFGAVLVLSERHIIFYISGWFTAWGLLFVVAIEGARQLRAPGPVENPPEARAAGIALALIAVVMGLLEYPFAAPIYTLYALPLAMVAAAALVRSGGRVAVALQLVVTLFVLAFGGLRILPGAVGSLGALYLPSREQSTLALPRGGLRVSASDSARYITVIALVREKAAGRPIWAGPDSPEIYFLSGIQNRTRTLFDFLDRTASGAIPPATRLDSLGVSLVVLKLQPDFSPPPDVPAVQDLERFYPHRRLLDGFLVMWR